jgi:hypothetical protein
MTIRLVGAGVGRTGTHSQKLALEQLLGGTCHHMVEVFDRPEQIAGFTAAIDGEPVDWHALLADFTAIVDFPGAMFWRELADAYPEAPVLLSVREPHGWYRSATNTIFLGLTAPDMPPDFAAWMGAMMRGMRDRFSDDVDNEAAMVAAFERHNAEVRATIPADRLFVWEPGDGWGPICAALGVPEPDAPYPVTNTTDEFRAMMGLPPIS